MTENVSEFVPASRQSKTGRVIIAHLKQTRKAYWSLNACLHAIWENGNPKHTFICDITHPLKPYQSSLTFAITRQGHLGFVRKGHQCLCSRPPWICISSHHHICCCAVSVGQAEVSALNMHERSNMWCIGVNDFLLSHYHKPFTAVVSWLKCDTITQSSGT